MLMRFWATMRRPAFSISALTAPVRLRSVASGLMIEKVRSIAMVFSPQINGLLELAALISTACAHGKRPSCRGGRALTIGNYNNFTKVNPVCSTSSPPVQERGDRLNIDRTPLRSRQTARDFTDLE